MSKQSRSYRRFNNAIKTDATRSNYSYAIYRFMRFLSEDKIVSSVEDYDALLEFNADSFDESKIAKM